MAEYVDGFVLVVPKKHLAAYKRMAKDASKIWKEHGALVYRECIADDLTTPTGVPFNKLAKARANETVVFSYVVYRSKAHRDQVNKKLMKDPRMQKAPDPMPFDMKRMSYGGFRVVVAA